jgi:MFS family permease
VGRRVLFGSQIFGWIGDRYGRKTALILANFLFDVLTFAAAYSTNLTELSWLRFLAGLGIGGVIPNVVAINGSQVFAAATSSSARARGSTPQNPTTMIWTTSNPIISQITPGRP